MVNFDFDKEYILENNRVLLRPLIASDNKHLLPFAHNEPILWESSLQSAAGETNMLKYIENAIETGTDRIEFYTGPYSDNFSKNKATAIAPFIEAANLANKLGLGINAGHDLNLANLNYFKNNINGLLEVSIGHALICDALYFGLENTIEKYLACLNTK